MGNSSSPDLPVDGMVPHEGPQLLLFLALQSQSARPHVPAPEQAGGELLAQLAGEVFPHHSRPAGEEAMGSFHLLPTSCHPPGAAPLPPPPSPMGWTSASTASPRRQPTARSLLEPPCLFAHAWAQRPVCPHETAGGRPGRRRPGPSTAPGAAVSSRHR